MTAKAPSKLLRIREVQQVSGLTESTIYQGMRRQTFPSSIALGGRSVAWRAADVQAWLDADPRRERYAASKRKESESSIIPKGEPSASMVRGLIAKSGHTIYSAADSIGISRRTMERLVTDGPGWKRPRLVILAALNVLSPPAHISIARAVSAEAGSNL